MADSSGVVTIIQPTEGTVFHPGNTVYVTVTVSNKNAKVLIATSTGESTLVESAPIISSLLFRTILLEQ